MFLSEGPLGFMVCYDLCVTRWTSDEWAGIRAAEFRVSFVSWERRREGNSPSVSPEECVRSDTFGTLETFREWYEKIDEIGANLIHFNDLN